MRSVPLLLDITWACSPYARYNSQKVWNISSKPPSSALHLPRVTYLFNSIPRADTPEKSHVGASYSAQVPEERGGMSGHGLSSWTCECRGLRNMAERDRFYVRSPVTELMHGPLPKNWSRFLFLCLCEMDIW